MDMILTYFPEKCTGCTYPNEFDEDSLAVPLKLASCARLRNMRIRPTSILPKSISLCQLMITSLFHPQGS